MNAAPPLTVVVAIEQSAANLDAILAALRPKSHPDCEFLFCATEPADLAQLPTELPQLRTLLCPAGSRIPQMWRDGIVAAGSDCVALLSAHAVPAPGWLPNLLARPLAADEAGVGGFFSNAAQATPLDWSIYLLRYAAFSRPLERASVGHIAADNAAYRRSEVLACPDLVAQGFWEVEYHVRFLAKGLRLAQRADLEVVHCNRYSAASFAAQRREHGFAFGRDRARRLAAPRLAAHALAAPLVPFVLFAKVLARVRRHGWFAAAPAAAYAWLLWFALHWAWGEAHGLFDEIFRRVSCAPWLRRRPPSP